MGRPRVAALAIAGCSGGDTGGSAPGTTSPPSDGFVARSEASDALLERTLTEDEPGCAAAVGVGGEVVPRNVAALVEPPAQRQSDLAAALDLDEARISALDPRHL